MVKKFDKNDDKKISYQEFAQIIKYYFEQKSV